MKVEREEYKRKKDYIYIPCQYCGNNTKVPWDFIGDVFCDKCIKKITINDLDREVNTNGRTTRI